MEAYERMALANPGKRTIQAAFCRLSPPLKRRRFTPF
jgi:hypothetical protein